MTLKTLWLMAQGARQARRLLALDVRELVWTRDKFDADKYVQTGGIATYQTYALPDTPDFRGAKEKLERERKQHEAR